MKLTDEQFEQYRASCIAAVGAPSDDLNEQHDGALKLAFQLLETLRGAGFDARVIPIASAAATVAHTASLTAADRKQIAESLRKAASEIEETGPNVTH